MASIEEPAPLHPFIEHLYELLLCTNVTDKLELLEKGELITLSRSTAIKPLTKSELLDALGEMVAQVAHTHHHEYSRALIKVVDAFAVAPMTNGKAGLGMSIILSGSTKSGCVDPKTALKYIRVAIPVLIATPDIKDFQVDVLISIVCRMRSDKHLQTLLTVLLPLKIQYVQKILLQSLGDNKSIKSTGFKLVSRLLVAHPVLVELAVVECNKVSDSNSALLSLLLQYSSTAGSESLLTKMKDSLVAVFIKDFIGARVTPAKSLTTTFSTVLKTVTQEEFGSVFVPEIVKFFKRQAEIVCPTVNTMMSMMNVDCGKFADALTPQIVALIKISKEPGMSDAHALFVTMVKTMHNAEHIVQAVGLFEAALDTNPPKPETRDCYLACLQSIASCISQLGKDGIVEVASKMVSVLVKVAAKEKIQAPLVRCVTSLGLWLSLRNKPLDDVASLINKGLTDATSGGDWARCLSQAVTSELVANSCGGAFSKSLIKLIKKAAAKSIKIDAGAIYSMHVLAAVTPFDVDVAGDEDGAALWGYYNERNCFLYPPSLIRPKSAIPEVEVSAVEDALKALDLALSTCVRLHLRRLKSSISKSTDTSAEVHPVLSALVAMCCHPLASIRRVSRKSVADIVKTKAELQLPLLSAFRLFLKGTRITTPELTIATAVANAEGKATGLASITLVPTVLRKTLTAILPQGSCSHRLLPCAMLLSHHPLLLDSEQVYGETMPAKSDTWLWKYVSKRFVAKGTPSLEVSAAVESIIASSEGVADALKTVLTSSEGVLSDNIQFRLAAISTIVTIGCSVSKEARTVAWGLVLPYILEHMSIKNMEALPKSAVDIYLTPEGEIWIEKKDSNGEYVPVVVENKNKKKATKKRKGAKGFGLDDDDDDDWVEQLKAKKEAELAAAKGMSEEDKKTLAEQADIRSKVAVQVEQMTASLIALGTIAGAVQPKNFKKMIPDSIKTLMPLLSSPLVDERAVVAARAVASAAAPEIRSMAMDIARLLQVIQSTPAAKAVSVCPDLFERVLTAVRALIDEQEFKLPASSLHLFLPILRAAVVSVPVSPLIDTAMAILAAHSKFPESGSKPTLRILRTPMISLTLSALEVKPSSEPKPDDILLDLCDGPVMTLKEMSPLFGNEGLLSSSKHVRSASIGAAGFITDASKNPLFVNRLFLCKFDEDEDNKEDATELWNEFDLKLPPSSIPLLIPLLSHKDAVIRSMAGRALAGGLEIHPASCMDIYGRLINTFEANMPEEKVLNSGDASTRSAIMSAFESCAKSVPWTAETIEFVFPLIVRKGLRDAVNQVRWQAMDTGMALVNSNGSTFNALLGNLIDKFMSDEPTKESEVLPIDWQREGLVVCLGALAKHMDLKDSRVVVSLRTLLDALSTPSESVQRAVSSCISPLMKSPLVQEHAETYLKQLLEILVSGESEDYGIRRGAAYGLAGAVKGLGVSSLKTYSVLDALQAAADNKKSEGAREGALFAFETLFDALGILFEPYILLILPTLLTLFSDKSEDVRDAAYGTSRTLMAKLSTPGVKIIMPKVLAGLQNSKWRTKQASIQMLGAMAYCAPKQLSSCLPQIVPRLIESFADTSKQVQDAGKEALVDIGKVVKNPEIGAIIPALLRALMEPAEHNLDALKILTTTGFVHRIDTPSLALIMPIVLRGMKDRSGKQKKQAVVIVGNMCSLIGSASDLVPYLPDMLREIEKVIQDPMPDVRMVAAKALGGLVRGMGEDSFKDFIVVLMDMLKGDAGSVERSGAAQALTQVMVALGPEKVEAFTNQIIPNINHPKQNVREGVMWFFMFMPSSMGKAFTPYIAPILQKVISGLSDNADQVREVAMKAGSAIVSQFSLDNHEDLLPTLESGMFNDNWRIRQSSVTLLGDLLFAISGTKAAGRNEETVDDDTGLGNEDTQFAISSILGNDTSLRLYAGLYIARNDTSNVVREQALQVWKSVVVNTSRTLLECMRKLMGFIVEYLASSSMERQMVAGRCLGDVVGKLGERVLREIVPILSKGLSSKEGNIRQGSCLGLCEVIDAGSKEQLEGFSSELMAAVQNALCDEAPEVREAAAKAFDTLQRTLGQGAVDEIVPSLIAELSSGERDRIERGLDGLKGILDLRETQIMPFLLPKLIMSPLPLYSVRAMEVIAKTTSKTLHKNIARMLPPLFDTAVMSAGGLDEELQTATIRTLDALMASISPAGYSTLVTEFVGLCGHANALWRSQACRIMEVFASKATGEYGEHLSNILDPLITLWNEKDDDVRLAAFKTLTALTNFVKPDILVNELGFIRTAVQNTASKLRYRKDATMDGADYVLPGLSIPRAIEPLLGVFHHGLMSGTSEIRRGAAIGLGELVTLSPSSALPAPVLIKLAGPLIRLLSQNLEVEVKSAILDTLGIVMNKGGAGVKPLVSQLQTTFVRQLQSSSTGVRDRAGLLLGKLIHLSVRVDPLVKELCTGISTSTGGVRLSTIEALYNVLKNAGDLLKKRDDVVEMVLQVALKDEDENIRAATADCFGAAMVGMPEEEIAATLSKLMAMPFNSLEWEAQHGVLMCAGAAMRHASKSKALLDVVPAIQEMLVEGMKNDKVPILKASVDSLGRLLALSGGASSSKLLPSVVRLSEHELSDVRKTAISVIKRLSKESYPLIQENIKKIVPVLMNAIKDRNMGVKLAAERALIHALKVHSDPGVVKAYTVSIADAEEGDYILNYCKRVLLKQEADSDSEKA